MRRTKMIQLKHTVFVLAKTTVVHMGVLMQVLDVLGHAKIIQCFWISNIVLSSVYESGIFPLS